MRRQDARTIPPLSRDRRRGTHDGGPRVVLADDPVEAWDSLRQSLSGDEVVLVKGSRGVRLERIVDKLAGHFGEED